MDLYHHGSRKFPKAGLVATSFARGWRGVAAELRSHPAGELPAIVPTQMEITLATRRSPGAFVARKGAGVRQRTAVEEGTIWLCPVGVGEDDISISAPLEEILHIYLPTDRFAALADLYGDSRISAHDVHYLADLRDPLIRQIGLAIRFELMRETSAGRMMVETAAMTLTARVVQAYGSDRPTSGDNPNEVDCPKRIQRAIDYIRDNLERDISISDLAEIACLSPFHFARMFKRVTGRTPHGFVSAERFDLARKLLADPEVSLVTVAHRTGFSTQAAFGTAFKRATGSTPGDYRRQIT
ncbi:HTH-type transcriptional activator Btr [Methylobrevis pamukkalensis]|uniref:HTH-type transcriptional activator Btr n=2 Tax=Methylobrevis pamukkalensis TaxID=1439726 RepID=A0A1E3H6V4_9HYPH|nr:HTH-type transcriptional activator Btr [Methylobrevis pamukkalensis]